ncbi:nucleoside diphosphate kinase 7-like isoform X2 [Gigantopelta aegis]|uniref:nucleoside diphosphate kinase 7-like isoform X2 n=1 Tax=Gigantopelta aegis TaxID=1735272 RepID=UPI001B88CBE0|nr:nucleoside diphosphate kinase 7-like isoform X2 [Gigantopelta aegis]
MADDNGSYSFLVEWYEEQAARIRQFLLSYHVKTQGVEMYCLKTRKTFLKTCLKGTPNAIELSDLFIGSTHNILGRQITIKDYGDEYTRNHLSGKKEKTFGLVKPDAVNKAGTILDQIYQKGFMIAQLKSCVLDRQEGSDFYQDHKDEFYMKTLVADIVSGPVLAFEIVGENAVGKWREMVGPCDPAEARKCAARSLRAQFGTDKSKNALHSAASSEIASRELEFFFPTVGVPRRNSASFDQCTCAVIKPHAVKAGLAGKIIMAITEANFEVTAIQMFHMDKVNAEEFYEVYKGVVAEYNGMVVELTSGPCIALEIRAQNAVTAFREMVGPADPEIARHLRPRTLRATFGVDKIKNAIHCTDLPEDGLLEVEYFFKILDR